MLRKKKSSAKELSLSGNESVIVPAKPNELTPPFVKLPSKLISFGAKQDEELLIEAAM